MALKNCPKCGQRVPGFARTCPHCGAAMPAPDNTSSSDANAGSSNWAFLKSMRFHQMGSLVVVMLGVIWMMVEINAVAPGRPVGTLPVVMICIGAAWYIGARAGKWF